MFKRPSKLVSYSPLRISFGGGGTDISPFIDEYGSAVLNTTIDRGVRVKYIADEFPLEISSRDFVKSYLISHENKPARNVSEMIMDLFGTRNITSGRVLMNSDVPPGSGLGSSSALTTSVMNLINNLNGRSCTPLELADESFVTERDVLKVTLGRQDPYAISIGGFKFIEFMGNQVKIEKFDNESSFLKMLEKSILLIYTGRTRESSIALAEQVEKSRAGEKATISRLLDMKSTAFEMRDAVRSQDFHKLTSLINKGWEIKKTLGKNVTNEKIDGIIGKARSSGALAARLLGGGSQGFVLVIAGEGRLKELQDAMVRMSRFVVRVSFDERGTRIVSRS
ncbi:MAG: kinase [Thermoplasmatales archaeon B_DKE]|nr:MAG: kinase [Thermoplasmatales archaeon B_DKE]QRF75615.1 Galactokinase [Thermoplasmatales archaeon]